MLTQEGERYVTAMRNTNLTFAADLEELEAKGKQLKQLLDSMGKFKNSVESSMQAPIDLVEKEMTKLKEKIKKGRLI